MVLLKNTTHCPWLRSERINSADSTHSYCASTDLVNTTPETFENRGFTLKMHQMFFIPYASLSGHFGFEGNPSREITFSKCFRSLQKANPAFLNYTGLKSVFVNKTPFSLRISEDGEPNRRNKDAFSNPSGLVWTGSKSGITHPMTSNASLGDKPCARAHNH